jgi:DNA modification methylase
LTDPPYAISRKTGFASVGENSVERFAVSMEFGQWDEQEIDISRFAVAAYRALKKSGTAIVFYDVWKFNQLADAMTDAGFKQLRLIIWEKSNPVPLNSKRNYLSNSREVAVLGVKEGKATFHSEYDNGVYRYPISHDGKRHHPTQKPLSLMIDLVKKHSDEGQLIVDPFFGSGTTALAAIQANRCFAGCDISEEYVSVARKRIEGAKK